MASWAIATTVKERVEIVLAFVAHHLEAGAGEIHLFFDDPDDPGFAWVEGVERVTAYRCDDAHWGGSRPERHQRRQSANAARAKAATACDWIGHIDIDEFLHGPGAIGDMLEQVDAEADAARVFPVERIFTRRPGREEVTFSGGFKRRMSAKLAKRIFGRHGPVLHRGFQGHANGKVFLRSRSPARLTIHNARIGAEGIATQTLDSLDLLHFFPFGFDAWREKFERRLTNPDTLDGLHLREQAKFRLYAEAEREGEAAVWSLFLALSYFGPARLLLLRLAGAYFNPGIDCAASVRRVFGPDAPLLDP